MAKAFGIVSSSGAHFQVKGMQEYRPISAFSFLGRYRVIDFPISNMSNSNIDRVHVYINSARPRSLTEHLGSGRIYNINSKRGKLQMLFANADQMNTIYNTDIAGYIENLEIIERTHEDYVVITSDYMVFAQNFDELLNKHIESGADITMLYHKTSTAKEHYLDCRALNLNKQKGVVSIEPNLGNTKDKNISMDTYVMSKELFIDLIKSARKLSSVYTLAQIINARIEELDVRAIQHKGFFAAITDLKSYFDSNMALLDIKKAEELIDPSWPIYTRTTDSCPTQFFDGSDVKNSFISIGCLIEGTVENSVIGRGCVIKKGAVVKNCVMLAYAEVGEGVHAENQVIDKWSKIIRTKEVVSEADNPGYVRRDDTL